MFVIMVVVKLMFSQSILSWCTKPFAPIFSHVFHISKQSISYVFAMMFLGFPSSAAFINEQVKQGACLPQDAKRLILSCSFATPGFVIMTCGTVLYHSSTLGIWLFCIQLLSGFILLFLSRSHDITSRQTSAAPLPFMYLIGGYLMLCMSIGALLVQFLPIVLQMFFRIVIEFSSGSMLISSLPISLRLQLALLSALLSFGGFCVHLQVMCMCDACALSYRKYFICRILQAILSASITYVFFPFFPS